jgi:endonuclease YncB( thermonuclease family)
MGLRLSVRGVKMSKVVLVAGVAVLVCVFGASVASARLTAGSAQPAGGVVSSVTDGDTLVLRDGRRVRLLQIDTPELGTGECYSRAARTALVALAPPGSRLTLEPDPRLDKVDRYGRLLRYLKLRSRNVNLELVRLGAAAPYFYGAARGKYAVALMRAAQQARTAGRGLWGACPATVLDPYDAVATGQSGPPAQPTPSSPPPPPTPPPSTSCDPNYDGGCVPPSPPDLDCADIRALGIAPVRVVGADPHRLDGDRDGWGCE